ncbi:receptor-type tyrosine-protein phosphatase gamma-like [Xenentodon cancila]
MAEEGEDHPNIGTNLAPHAKPGSGVGLGRAEWLLPLVVLFAPTFFYVIPLLVVLLHWRRCFLTAHFHEEYCNLLTVPNEIVPFFPIQDDMEAIPARRPIKQVSELFSYNELGFSEDFEEVLRCPADMNMMLGHSNNSDNKCKNRSIHRVACDCCRVELRPLAGKDCINIIHVDVSEPSRQTLM